MIESEDEKRKKSRDETEEEGGSGEGSSGHFGGSGGAIEFHEFITLQEDKKLSPEEEKELLALHREITAAFIEKQKDLRKLREEKKEGREVGYEINQGKKTDFLKHPILGEAAEFDGFDPKVNVDPTLYEAETNSEKKEELVYQHQLRLQLANQPVFNPKPSPY